MSLPEKALSASAPDRKLLEIAAPLSVHLQQLNEIMVQQVENFEQDIQEMVRYCLTHSGKRLRPILVFYSGWSEQDASLAEHITTDDKLSDQTADHTVEIDSRLDNLIKMASIIEWIHIATLVHDDILDGATLRRKRPTVNQIYGLKSAVLLGDAIFAQALQLTTTFSQLDVCNRVAEATRRVCEGEIIQTLQQNDGALSIEAYFNVIDLKTAELFSLSCFIGAQFGGYDDNFSQAASLFGRHLGRAYQIYDDIADLWGKETAFGKTLGTDLDQGKLTLPLLLLFKQIAPAQKEKMLQDIQKNTLSIKALKTLLQKHNIFEATVESFLKEITTAEAAIKPFEQLPATKQLLTMGHFVKKQPQKLNIS